MKMRTEPGCTLALVLAAAGSSSRMGTKGKKEYLPLKRGTVLSESARAFLEAADFAQVIVSIPQGAEREARNAFFSDPDMHALLKNANLIFTEGGSTRQESVFRALLKISSEHTAVLIHDAARPFVSKEIIQSVISAACAYGAAAPVIAPVDTQKELAPDGTIARHLARKSIGAVQTPQGFLSGPLIACHRKAAQQGLECTDDTEIWDAFPELTGGKKVFCTKGSAENRKITFSQDMEERQEMRIGIGTDMHRLTDGRALVLGGVRIPCEKGELGHSDGDVLLHAIADALLGAAGLGDIGSYFPPEDPEWKDADSALLLKKIWSDIKKAGWTLNNLDCVIEIEQPKILPWRQKIRESVARILEAETESVFVKAKTNEKLGAVGAWEAARACCVCLLAQK